MMNEMNLHPEAFLCFKMLTEMAGDTGYCFCSVGEVQIYPCADKVFLVIKK